jgi:hypothetical protein
MLRNKLFRYSHLSGAALFNISTQLNNAVLLIGYVIAITTAEGKDAGRFDRQVITVLNNFILLSVNLPRY